MRMLSCVLLVALSASPALAGEAAPDAGAQVTAPQEQPAAQDAQPKKKRALACPACRTNQDPSFAIRPATENGNGQAATAGAPQTDVTGNAAAAPPPVNFSFAGSGDGSRSNRYRGGVYMATPF